MLCFTSSIDKINLGQSFKSNSRTPSIKTRIQVELVSAFGYQFQEPESSGNRSDQFYSGFWKPVSHQLYSGFSFRSKMGNRDDEYDYLFKGKFSND